ncbi:MAG TPA: class I SAM-dependent methyltransferase [Bdellovibrionota bacterium]|nr:class I SAM-dependent methyltransferase [Bdellovibrionota bacterium]
MTTPETKRAWAEIVTPEDLDQHLEMIGQAAANGGLASRMLADFPLADGSSLFVPGAGTGQLLDFCDRTLLASLRVAYSEINSSFAQSLQARLKKYGLKGQCLLEDLEQAPVSAEFDAILMILLLEHIDWQRGLQNLLSARPSRLFVIIQRNEEGAKTINTSRQLAPSIKKFSEVAKPRLIAASDLEAWLRDRAYTLIRSYESSVPDQKTMVGLVFHSQKS